MLTETSPLAPPSPNGAGPRMPRHEAWLAVPSYPGYEVLGWTNPSQRTILDLDSRDPARTLPAIRALLVACRTVTPDQTFDYWFDADGEPFPQASEPDFIEEIPTELLSMAIRVVRYEGPHRQGQLFLTSLLADRRGSG